MVKFPLKVALIYALVSIAWISASDQALNSFFKGQELVIAQSYQGWVFILFTTIMLWLFLRQEYDRREQTEQTLREQRDNIKQLSLAVSQSPVSVFISDIEGRIQYVNRAFEMLTGYEADDVIGKNTRLLDPSRLPSDIANSLWEKLNQGDDWVGELNSRNKEGNSYWVKAHISPVVDDHGQTTHYLAMQEDITEFKNKENQIKHQANYDSLTELPNRFLAMDRMGQAINNAIRNDQPVVLMIIDLDDFKRINDSMGQEVGDQMISIAAGRISETVRQTDTVARYGGDEFVIILNHLDSATDAPRVAEKVLSNLANSFFIDGNELNITASIGMAIFPDDGQDPYELLRHADAATYAAKDAGGNCYEFYSADVNEAAVQRMRIEQQLRSALEKNEFNLHFQPLVDIDSSQIKSAEVLLRWANPELGDVKPDIFLPLAESTGLIIPIGEWVVEQACKQLKEWSNQGISELSLMLNVSQRQFSDINFSRSVIASLDKYELDGKLLSLEIKESILIRDTERTRRILDRLRKRGIHIALDNFGSEQTSLNNLKDFPFDTLKIDRSYITDLIKRSSDDALVQGTLNIAKNLGMKTVGEGVESNEQYDFLKTHGIDQVQGFLFTPALPAAEFVEYCQGFKQTRDSEQAQLN